MKGTWVLPPISTAAANENLFVPFSTSVPIPEVEVGVFAHSLPPGAANPADPFGCTGTAEQPKIEPTETVPPGAILLCVYEQEANNIKQIQAGFGTKLINSGAGAVGIFRSEGNSAEKGLARAYGSWALKIP